MCCSFSVSLPLLLLLLYFPSIPCVSTNQPPNKEPPNTTSMDPSELDTLFTIMDTMSSDQTWRLTNPNPCQPGSSWPGLECKPGTNNDNHLHVTRLDFGTPTSPSCNPNATFPSKIFSLPHLQSAFFFNCFTLTKTTLSVPQNRVLISPLQQLSLRSNPALTGSIPPQISSLKSLHILTLSQNSLTGQIPVELFNLSSLLHLDLSYNLLTNTIPRQIGKLKNLLGLDLSYNSLTGSIPHAIGELGMLQKLDLSSNSLVGSIPDTIQNLTSLAFMALSNNKLAGAYPKGLAKLKSLQYLIMDDNPMFTSLPIELGQLHKLQELRLANSGLSGTIPQTLGDLMNLGTLSLQNNRLTGEIPVGLGGLSHIYHLNLSKNMLGGVVPFNSRFLKRLGRNLDLSGNAELCLSPSEPYGVKIGVGVCGTNKSGGGGGGGAMIEQAMKKSEAPSGFFNSFLIFGALGVLTLHQIYYLLV